MVVALQSLGLQETQRHIFIPVEAPVAYRELGFFLLTSDCRESTATTRWLGVVLPHLLLSGHMAVVVAITI